MATSFLQTRLLGNWRLWQKFALIGLTAIILVAIPFYYFAIEKQELVEITLRQEKGLQPAKELLSLLQVVARHRGSSTGFLNGNEALAQEVKTTKELTRNQIASFDTFLSSSENEVLNKPWDKIKKEWVNIDRALEARTANAQQNFQTHTALITQILRLLELVVDNYQLSLASEPESYYLIEAILITGPALSEYLGQSRGWGTALLAKSANKPGSVSLQERVALAGMVYLAKDRFEAIERTLEKAQKATPKYYKSHIDKPFTEVSVLIEKAFNLSETEIIKAESPNYSSSNYYNQYTETIQQCLTLLDEGFSVLSNTLQDHARSIKRERTYVFSFIAGIFIVGLFITLNTALSITEPVGRLVQIMNRLTAGDTAVRARLGTTDEIGTLGRQFDLMMDQREMINMQVQRENDTLNNSIIDLLQAVARLAQKDLTVRIPVAEDITGPLADALNLLSNETAYVLNQVVEVAEGVADISEQVKSHSDIVINVATEEKREVEQAAVELNLASEVMQDIAKLALSCNEAAEQAIQNTDKAQETVLNTVQGITTIRDTIRETEKRIKRLGERSQEIGGVVNLINSIAERTHILALNASMHAASAGEAGRGFAVVANEVQKLAENAREATSKISGLVNNIQVETADTVITMNDAITQVVQGTSLAQQAGTEMRKTRDTTARLVELVQRIASSSTEQAKTTQQLRERAVQIQKGAEETYQRLQDQGKQTERLVKFSGNLVASVSVFVLPKRS